MTRPGLRVSIAMGLMGLLLGCQSSRLQGLNTAVPVPASGDYRHEASGMLFPTTVSGFERVAIIRYDRDGKDVSVGYNYENMESPVAVTVYVYPAPRVISIFSPESVTESAKKRLMQSEFEAAKASVTEAHHGVQILEETDEFLTQGGKRRPGKKARFEYEDVFAGVRQPLVSLLLLFCNEDWSVKYRITYPRASADASATESRRFLEDFRWDAAR